MADETYLILGASGLIGSHLYRRLAQQRPASPVWGTCHTRRRHGLIPHDLAQGGWPVPEARGPGVLFVCSAMAGLGQVFEHQGLAHHTNVVQTQRLILDGQSRGFRTVFLSTDKVYGQGEGPFREEQAGEPSTLYGRLKWEMETWLGSHCEDALVVRLSKVYGTERCDESVVEEIARTLGAGRLLTCCPDVLFQPTHVDDVVTGILGLVGTGATGAWNLAHPQAWSRLDFGVAICRRLGLRETLIRAVPVRDLQLNEPYPPDGRLDVSRFFRRFPEPFLPLEQGIARLDPTSA
jgi:dTDP-4-dehydrorhamnose reductase